MQDRERKMEKGRNDLEERKWRGSREIYGLKGSG